MQHQYFTSTLYNFCNAKQKIKTSTGSLVCAKPIVGDKYCITKILVKISVYFYCLFALESKSEEVERLQKIKVRVRSKF